MPNMRNAIAAPVDILRVKGSYALKAVMPGTSGFEVMTPEAIKYNFLHAPVTKCASTGTAWQTGLVVSFSGIGSDAN